MISSFEEFLGNMRRSLAHIKSFKDQYSLTDEIGWCAPGIVLSQKTKDRIGEDYKGDDHVYTTLAGAYLLKNSAEDIESFESFRHMLDCIKQGDMGCIAETARQSFNPGGRSFVNAKRINLAYRMTDPVEDWNDVDQVCLFFSQFHYRFTDNPKVPQ